jgi:hypothetical protein
LSTETKPPPLKRLFKADGLSKAEHGALVAERKAIQARGGRPPVVQPTRDVLLQRQYEAMTAIFPKLVARLNEAIDNKDDPLHERAVDLMTKRAMTSAFYEALAKQEFRPDEEKNQRPVINIVVNGGAGVSLKPVDDEPIDV